MRVAITGASGNLGTALLRHLSARATHDLVGISRRPPPVQGPYAGVEWHAVDLSQPERDAAKLARALQGADAVVHLAWLIQPSHDRQLMRATNQGGTRLVADTARATGVAHVVHVSSIGAYSPAPGRRVDESHPVGGVPSSPYSVDKAACERLLDDYEADLVLARIRPTLVLQEAAASEIMRYFLGPLVPRWALNPTLLRVLPWPDQLVVQFVHADDVAAAIATVLKKRAAGAFNVAADPAVDRDLYRRLIGNVGPALPPRLLHALAASSWRIRLQPTDPGWLDLALSLPTIDSTRLRRLGWSQTRPGTEVLRAFLAAMRRGAGGPGPLLYPRGSQSPLIPSSRLGDTP